MKCIVDKLRIQQRLAPEEYRTLLTMRDPQDVDYLMTQAREVAQQQFGKGIYLRGLIELTNVCRNDCLYCGIRRSNGHVLRYTLTREQVLACCEQGYELGCRWASIRARPIPCGRKRVQTDICFAMKPTTSGCIACFILKA